MTVKELQSKTLSKLNGVKKVQTLEMNLGNASTNKTIPAKKKIKQFESTSPVS